MSFVFSHRFISILPVLISLTIIAIKMDNFHKYPKFNR